MVKELEARVAAAIATAVAPVVALQKRLLVEEVILTSEISPKVINITFHFAGFPQKKIIRIFHNKFKPINLY